jgi:AAA domain (dynein-related subfamily)
MDNTPKTTAQAIELATIQLDAGEPVMFWGAPGIGKSDAVRQIAAATGRNVIDFRTNLREPVDMRGIPVPCDKTGTTKWYTPDELPQVERDGERGILFLDEINTCSPQMMAVCFGLVLDRKVGEYTLPAGWIVVAAGNRVADRAAAQRMPTALSNRFAHHTIVADVDAWADWANKNGIAPELVAFIRLRRELLHVMPKNGESTFPTPRSWAKCSKYMHAPAKLRLALFASHVGDAYAAELEAFIELYRSMGSLADIIKNPAGAKLPTDPSARYAVCTGLARMAKPENIAAIFAYAERLPKESQILVIHDATTREPKLKNTATYGRWAVANADLIIQ